MTKRRFSDLYRKHFNQLFRFSRRLTRDEAKAKDLMQDASIKAYRNIEKLDECSNFRSWFSTILRNTHFSHYVKIKRRREMLQANGKTDGFFYNRKTCTNDGDKALLYQDIRKEVESLSPKYRDTFILNLKGYAYKEISDTLNIAIGTVKSRINACRNKLKSQLANVHVA